MEEQAVKGAMEVMEAEERWNYLRSLCSGTAITLPGSNSLSGGTGGNGGTSGGNSGIDGAHSSFF
jgi:hypothetical protein